LEGDVEDWFRKCYLREVYLISKQKLEQHLVNISLAFGGKLRCELYT
jgi:hypothetical protein